jgi:hypothetical protein
MIVAASLARARIVAARGDALGVVGALEPVRDILHRSGVDEPGFWPWQDIYAEALVMLIRSERPTDSLPHMKPA